MADIATIEEFAYVIRLDVVAALKHVLLLDLAEGLVIAEIGEHDPWPAAAKAVALSAAARAFFNPTGSKSEAAGGLSRSFPAPQMGVYLTDEEVDRLHSPASRRATYSFPGTWPYPDPVERTADVVSG